MKRKVTVILSGVLAAFCGVRLADLRAPASGVKKSVTAPAIQAKTTPKPASTVPSIASVPSIPSTPEVPTTPHEQQITRLLDRPAAPSRDAALVHAITRWVSEDVAAALAWLEAHAPEKTADTVWSAMIRASALTIAADSPRDAARLILGHLGKNDPNRDIAVTGIVQRLVQERPADAARWVAEFPAGHLQREAARELMGLWCERDVNAAAGWINTLASGALKDTAIAALSTYLALRSRDHSLRWAALIQNTALRLETETAIDQARTGPPTPLPTGEGS
jgi:hypothetical protein